MSYRSEYKTLYYRRQHETRNFYLLIYKSECEKIQAWTDKYQDLETGGDLFGLWANDNTAVVQLVVGPGKNCKRTAVSFYQDLEYLKQIGNQVTNEEGLCHIGEWHSHHRLSLTARPSGGDEDTVWSNMDKNGLSRFCLLIANIKGSCYRSETTQRDVTVNGFLFEVDLIKKRRLPVFEGKFRFLQEESPLRSKNIDALYKGAEDSLAQRDVPINYQTMELDLKKYVQRMKELEKSLASERDAREQTERRLQRSEERSRDLETSLTAERQAKEETESRLQRSEQRSRDLDTSLVAERNTRVELEERLRRNEQRSRELETTLATVQQDFEEYRSSRESSCDWILAGNEIALSDKVIGKGGWGEVIEGTFGGCQVAVKKIHQLILSPHNRELFEREMNIASKCRHPCLLQFIGATNCNDNESPLFVTELLDTGLRALLQERALEVTEITTIALDVSKGLNYLHLKRPAPIIHRDISSANVLLWKRGSDWRAKVSDYGMANFLQQTMTVCPGAVVYSAPEARTSRQSPKVDVYSFGVLLCEMNIRELPNIEQRNRQVSRVRNGIYRTLIRRCLKQNPEERPSMAEIIQECRNY